MKVFVFDADGVVCVGANFGGALEKEHRIPRSRLAPFFAGPFPGCIVGKHDLKEELAAYLPQWGWRGSVEEFLAFWFQREHVLCPYILACVRTLRSKGHVCVLATNQERYRTEYLRSEMGLAKEFDHVFPSCELAVAKPAREFFIRVQERLRQTADNLCLIDDSERNLLGAAAVGWSTIHYRNTSDILRIEDEAGQGSA